MDSNEQSNLMIFVGNRIYRNDFHIAKQASVLKSLLKSTKSDEQRKAIAYSTHCTMIKQNVLLYNYSISAYTDVSL